jgi:hypothetical protein
MGAKHGYTNKPGVCAKCGKALPAPRPVTKKLCDECDPDKALNAEIVKLVDQGLSNADVGARLGLSASAITGRLNRMGKTRPFPKISAAQLKQCRLDPMWEVRPENRGIVPVERIVCRECGEIRGDLNSSGGKSHLLNDHPHTPPEAYLRKYPGARLTPFARHFARYAGNKTIESWLDEFAALYVTPAELAKCRKDPAWEARRGITNFVVCRLCGLKKQSSISGHKKNGHLVTAHGMPFSAYRVLFPKAPQMPETERAGRRQRHSAWAKRRFKLAKEADKFNRGDPVTIGPDRVLTPKGGRPAETKKGARIDELANRYELAGQRVDWPAIQKQIAAEFSENTAINSLQRHRGRYLKRQG